MGTTTTIKASARISTKIGDNFYTFEYTEERSVAPDCDLPQERAALFDDCYGEVYQQINDTINNS